MTQLTIPLLCKEAELFSSLEGKHAEKSLYGVTDGKVVGTYLEQKLRKYLQDMGYTFQAGNSGSGIDFPDLDVDMKVTSIRQPQSSCPYKSARQKIYGLGYSLIVFVYDKADDHRRKTATLNILHTIFVEKSQMADYQMTRGLRDILDKDGNVADLMGFMSEKNLPVDEIELENIAKELLQNRPEQGFLTISTALQWRLNYTRVIAQAGAVEGVTAIFKNASL